LEIFSFNKQTNILGIDKIFVINLKTRKYRKKTMIQISDYLNLNFTFFSAINSEDVKKDFAYINKPDNMRDGQIACWLSHMNIYEKIVNSSYIDKAIILEDDIDIHIDIIRKTNLALDKLNNNNWDILFLGHCSKEEGNIINLINSKAQLFKAQYPSCTHGYIITKKGASKMLNYRDKPNTIDWQIGDLGLEKYLDIYILSPPIILQYHSKNDFSDVNPNGNIYDPVDSIFNLEKFSTRKYINLN
jgi:GR25 family glycosyltransferase involved in LPS biosynthesis